MKRDEMLVWLKSRGYTKSNRSDKIYSKIKSDGRHHRYVVSSIAVRFESKSEAGWVRIRSGYLKNLSITADNKLSGLTR